MTFRDESKLSMALISPMQPIWNKSSTFSLLEEKRLMTLSTSLRLPSMYFSRASLSPCSMREKSASFSAGFNRGRRDVLTPQISTLPCAIL